MTTTIGIGTTHLAEFALACLLHCPACKGKGCHTLPEPARRLPDCRECGGTGRNTDWLNGLGDGTDHIGWRAYSDWIEENHAGGRTLWTIDGLQINEMRAARMVARLLVLDVWPDTRNLSLNGGWIYGWWPGPIVSVLERPPEAHINRLGTFAESVFGTMPSIEAALVRLDKALHPEEYTTQ